MNNMWGSMAQFDAIYWPWPIAIYLFLAGLSAGAMIVAVLLKDKSDITHKVAACIAPIAICIGLALLVFDLGKPLNFYWILIKYNFMSVMSIGVALLLVYTPLSFVYMALALKDTKPLNGFKGILDAFAPMMSVLGFVLLILAVGVGVYTGFLLSDVEKILLWNTPVLPVLFLVSGLSSGIAMSVFCSVVFFKDYNHAVIEKLLKFDMLTMVLELVLIAALFGLLLTGGDQAVNVAKTALSSGSLAIMFWVFVVGSGLVLPVVLELANGKAMSKNLIVFNTFIVLMGVILLRYYIVYAGQM
ncbi:NrfD/PsrC family molybdoenzyme membrane anchor subunit [Campylobacter mucosalis]|uniref:NrfD/PsrC family molybdoenzyme membrane anchor subunit n=1 Tax=Campylobacter mucosalis TaxID=202 RepID=UPI00146FDC46|nr:NrfD/PsrC family molybdoenzyme membrane anchor subunit [Campylobacter mucosalis]